MFQCKEGNCSLKLPAQPREATSKTAKGPTRSYRVIENECLYMFSVVEIPELKTMTATQIEKRLDKTSAMMDAAHSKVTLMKKITLGEHPGREARQASLDPEKTDGVEATRSRTFIVGTKLYVIIILGKQSTVDSARSTRILESLKLDPGNK